MNNKLKNDELQMLFEAIKTLKTDEDYYSFFEDLCTVAEMQSLAQRFAVAAFLMQGKTYNDISQKTGASTATISRVARCLMYGADGYKLVFERLNAKQEP